MIEYEIIKQIELPKIKRDRRIKDNTPKKIAAENGSVYFYGKICLRGHDGLRYTKGGQCVHCIGLRRGKEIQRSTFNHELSLKAASLGETTYVSEKPCKQGHFLRFVQSNNCVECDKIQREKHKLSAKFSRIKKEYNLTKEEYFQLVKTQSSSCKICNSYQKDHFKLHIDHCHKTNKVRGLLCNKCNQGLGLFNHNSKLLHKAILYCDET